VSFQFVLGIFIQVYVLTFVLVLVV